MPLDLESIGGGALTGFVASILTLLGWNKRLSDLEKGKSSIAVCDQKHDEIKAVQEKIYKELEYIRSRVDKVIDYQLNGIKK